MDEPVVGLLPADQHPVHDRACEHVVDEVGVGVGGASPRATARARPLATRSRVGWIISASTRARRVSSRAASATTAR